MLRHIFMTEVYMIVDSIARGIVEVSVIVNMESGSLWECVSCGLLTEGTYASFLALTHALSHVCCDRFSGIACRRNVQLLRMNRRAQQY